MEGMVEQVQPNFSLHDKTHRSRGQTVPGFAQPWKVLWILGGILEKSLNFCASPWKVLFFPFFSTLNVVTRKVFFDAFWLSKTNINHGSENLKVIYIKCTIINYQFKTSELKNVEKLVKQTVQALKPFQNRVGMCIFVQSVKSYS